ncbi:hypothetical protein QAD02_004592 [Eretmocerus hayati]|uniref:Uncharacterized protein n=1 Tax=Eretmocerus hayati TaxID=131215 RepID=A0ACC2NPZ6_9HYME|nr:hypothetical protein QAD02_004592 [Eretmocerus hayati]
MICLGRKNTISRRWSWVEIGCKPEYGDGFWDPSTGLLNTAQVDHEVKTSDPSAEVTGDMTGDSDSHSLLTRSQGHYETEAPNPSSGVTENSDSYRLLTSDQVYHAVDSSPSSLGRTKNEDVQVNHEFEASDSAPEQANVSSRAQEMTPPASIQENLNDDEMQIIDVVKHSRESTRDREYIEINDDEVKFSGISLATPGETLMKKEIKTGVPGRPGWAHPLHIAVLHRGSEEDNCSERATSQSASL